MKQRFISSTQRGETEYVPPSNTTSQKKTKKRKQTATKIVATKSITIRSLRSTSSNTTESSQQLRKKWNSSKIKTQKELRMWMSIHIQQSEYCWELSKIKENIMELDPS